MTITLHEKTFQHHENHSKCKASEEAGLSTALVMPLGDIMHRAVKAGFGASNISSMVEVIRNGLQKNN